MLAVIAHQITHDARDAAWIGAGAAVVVACISYLGVRTARKTRRDLSTGNGKTAGQTLYQVWGAITQIRDTLGLLVDATRAHEQMLANLDEGLNGLGAKLNGHLDQATELIEASSAARHFLEGLMERDRLAQEGRIERRAARKKAKEGA